MYGYESHNIRTLYSTFLCELTFYEQQLSRDHDNRNTGNVRFIGLAIELNYFNNPTLFANQVVTP